MAQDEERKNLIKRLMEQPKNTSLLLIGTFLIGVLLFTASRLETETAVTDIKPITQTVMDTEITRAERDLENRLKGILSQVRGVGEVEISIFLAAGTNYDYAINVNANKRLIDEQDQSGGVRMTTEDNSNSQYVLIRGGQTNQEQPVIIQETRPKILGVLIVADGAKDGKIKRKLIKAVEVALGLEAHRIQVLSREAR